MTRKPANGDQIVAAVNKATILIANGKPGADAAALSAAEEIRAAGHPALADAITPPDHR